MRRTVELVGRLRCRRCSLMPPDRLLLLLLLLTP